MSAAIWEYRIVHINIHDDRELNELGAEGREAVSTLNGCDVLLKRETTIVVRVNPRASA